LFFFSAFSSFFPANFLTKTLNEQKSKNEDSHKKEDISKSRQNKYRERDHSISLVLSLVSRAQKSRSREETAEEETYLSLILFQSRKSSLLCAREREKES